jgi:hypothetical protein
MHPKMKKVQKHHLYKDKKFKCLIYDKTPKECPAYPK